jgi:hypothetical protein
VNYGVLCKERVRYHQGGGGSVYAIVCGGSSVQLLRCFEDRLAPLGSATDGQVCIGHINYMRLPVLYQA